jgi:hypothetical protein
MAPSVLRIVERLQEIGDDLGRGVHEQRRRWRSTMRRGRVRFDGRLGDTHGRLKQDVAAYIREGSVLSLLTAPIIYTLIVPLALLEVWTTVYQWVCFPIYGIDRVPRRRYLVIDRHKLAYLNTIEKANCTFCSYANGLVAYVREVAARTEQYWCPIRHARPIPVSHARYRLFFDYGDARRYHHELQTVRHALRRDRRRTHRHPRRRRHGRD